MDKKYFDEIINEVVGIRVDAHDLTPMDKGECKSCLKYLKNEYEQREADRWVKVETELPEHNVQVLGCAAETLDVYICFYKRNVGFQIWGLGRKQPITDIKIAYWQPLPTPPIK